VQAADLLAEVGADNAFMQYDIYHAQRMEGELAATIRSYLPRIGHIQLADNPGRNEPGTGEIHYPFLFAHLDRIGYQGWIGCEYKPATTTEAGLGWRQSLGADLARRRPCLQDITRTSMTTPSPPDRLHRPGHHGHAHGRPPDEGRATACSCTRAASAGGDRAQAPPLPGRKGVAQRADIVITMLPDTPDVEGAVRRDGRGLKA
jgi:hypothetical protein